MIMTHLQIALMTNVSNTIVNNMKSTVRQSVFSLAVILEIIWLCNVGKLTLEAPTSSYKFSLLISVDFIDY